MLRELISALKAKFKGQDEVAVTASTGMAACNVGGQTIHSFAGIGLGQEPASELLTRVKKNTKSKMRWQKVKVLVIDEGQSSSAWLVGRVVAGGAVADDWMRLASRVAVSMVDGALFDKLEYIAKNIKFKGKGVPEPFGGIQVSRPGVCSPLWRLPSRLTFRHTTSPQLVVTGDFFQLPPVTKSGSSTQQFAFESEAWAKSITKTVNLTQVFRQKDERKSRVGPGP